MAKKPDAESVVLSIRLSGPLRAELERLAARDHRTLSGLVKMLLEKFVKDSRGGK
jgi:hypothetical protein